MPLCSLCKEDLKLEYFTKSQIKKGRNKRKCKQCVSNNKKVQKWALNTHNVVHSYYQRIMFSCWDILTPLMINLIFEYSGHAATIGTLHGEYMHSRADSAWELAETATGYFLEQYTITLSLCQDLTFTLMHRDSFNMHSSSVNGHYKCYKNKKLKFEGLFKKDNNAQGAVCEFDAVIVYYATNIALRVNMPHQLVKINKTKKNKSESIELQRLDPNVIESWIRH